MTAKKKKNDDVIEKKEHYSFTKKFTDRELKAKQTELSEKLMEKYNHEQIIVRAKDAIKAGEREPKNLSDEIQEGGVDEYEECDVKICRSTNKKEYYYEGELVGEEEAEEEDFQLEIEQD